MTDETTWEWVKQSLRDNADHAVIVRLHLNGSLSFLHGDPTPELERELAALREQLATLRDVGRERLLAGHLAK